MSQAPWAGEPYSDNPRGKKSGFWVGGLVTGIVGLIVAGVVLGAVTLYLAHKSEQDGTPALGVKILGVVDIIGGILFGWLYYSGHFR